MLKEYEGPTIDEISKQLREVMIEDDPRPATGQSGAMGPPPNPPPAPALTPAAPVPTNGCNSQGTSQDSNQGPQGSNAPKKGWGGARPKVKSASQSRSRAQNREPRGRNATQGRDKNQSRDSHAYRDRSAMPSNSGRSSSYSRHKPARSEISDDEWRIIMKRRERRN